MTYEAILARMLGAYTAMSGSEPAPASDVGIRMRVLAKTCEALYGELAECQGQAFPQTATGEHLAMHAQTRGITRKPALAATGALRFRRETPAAGDIPLPEGLICATRGDPQLQFETTEDAVLAAGQTMVIVPARATVPGSAGNVAQDAVCLMITAAPGITAAANPIPFSGGVDAEEDDALRARLLHSYSNISNGTNTAFYYDIAMGHEEVRSVNVLPRRRGRGTVDVVICCQSAEGEETTAGEIEAIFSKEKEINVDVKAYPAERDLHPVSVGISVHADADFDIVAEHCKNRVASFIEKLGVGEPLLCARLGRAILDVEGVYNYRLGYPAADVLPMSDHVVRPGAVTVERMMEQ